MNPVGSECVQTGKPKSNELQRKHLFLSCRSPLTPAEVPVESTYFSFLFSPPPAPRRVTTPCSKSVHTAGKRGTQNRWSRAVRVRQRRRCSDGRPRRNLGARAATLATSPHPSRPRRLLVRGGVVRWFRSPASEERQPAPSRKEEKKREPVFFSAHVLSVPMGHEFDLPLNTPRGGGYGQLSRQIESTPQEWPYDANVAPSRDAKFVLRVASNVDLQRASSDYRRV